MEQNADASRAAALQQRAWILRSDPDRGAVARVPPQPPTAALTVCVAHSPCLVSFSHFASED